MSLAQQPDLLLIVDEDGNEQSRPLSEQSISIGRAPQNELVLDASSVSSKHALLERVADGWQVTDLNSTNGTFIRDSRLQASSPQPWLADEPLRISSYVLTWRPDRSSVIEASAPSTMVIAPSTQVLTALPSQLTNLGSITLDTHSVYITPGEEKNIQVNVANESALVDQFTFQIEGVPAKWVTFSVSTVQLMPDREATFTFTIRPPILDVPAQTYPLKLILQSISDEHLQGIAFVNVHVLPNLGFFADFSPKQLKNRGNSEIIIRNTGNTEARFTVSGKDPGDEVIFTPWKQNLSMAPGQEERSNVRVSPTLRPWTGTAKKLPFEFQITPNEGDSLSLPGQLDVTPRLPAWFVTVLMATLLGIIGISAFTANSVRSRAKQEALTFDLGLTREVEEGQARATAVATATLVAAESATFTAAGAATIVAETATRIFVLLDEDNDGLTFEVEQKIGTDPTKYDTDADGLSDGDEIDENNVQLRGTDPKVKDTDNDGLLDGEEVNCNPDHEGVVRGQCTNPASADSDKDGIQDNIDEDSSQYPTPTPIPPNNKFEDPSFELGGLPWVNVNSEVMKQELNVPAGWKLLVDDNVPVSDNEEDGLFFFPEMGPVTMEQLNECREGRFEAICQLFVDEHILKVFKGGSPIRFALYRDVFLEPGVYQLSINYFADAVESYDGDQKLFGSPGSAQLQLCVRGAEYDHMDWEDAPIGEVQNSELEIIVPTARSVTLFAKFKNIEKYSNNGWFFDNWLLTKTKEFEESMAGKSANHGCRVDLTLAQTN